MANSVDLATMKLRELQGMIYNRSVSPDDLFKKTEEVMKFMHDASIEINTNYEEISEKLTMQMNTGRKQ